MTWSHETEERLKSLWAGGATAGEISKELGISRNAVMGKAHRLGCEARINPAMTESAKFERIIDLIANTDATLPSAARAVEMSHERAIALWREMCEQIGWQAV